MKKIVSVGLLALLYPVYGEEPFTCAPTNGETVVYCNDFNSPNSLIENTAYADVYRYENTTYSGSGSAEYTSQKTVEIIGLNLAPGATANTNGVYKDENDSSNKYTLGLAIPPGQTAFSDNADIMGFIFDAKDPQGNFYKNIQVEFDIAPAFLASGSSYTTSFAHENINFSIWEDADASMVGAALFDGEKTLSNFENPAFPPPLLSDALDSDILTGGIPMPYTGPYPGPIQNYPVNFKTVSTTLSTNGLVDPDGKVTLLLSLDNSSANFAVSKRRYGLIDNLKITATNRANPSSVSAIPSLTFAPLLALMGLFGWMTSYRLKRR